MEHIRFPKGRTCPVCRRPINLDERTGSDETP